MTPSTRIDRTPSRRRGRLSWLDSGGVLGAVFAALCCAGTPLIVSGLAALGLSALRSDAILWPLMIASLLVALWGFWHGVRIHRQPGPILAALGGGAALTAGVIFVHGFPAMQLIWGGAAVLVASTVWNVRARRACEWRP
jgi:mercuric ion transport protein